MYSGSPFTCSQRRVLVLLNIVIWILGRLEQVNLYLEI